MERIDRRRYEDQIIVKRGCGLYVKFYTWQHPEYRDFMMKILTNLSPRHSFAGEILFKENEEVNEIIFV